MSALAVKVVEFDPLRDSRHRNARSARDLADYLAWKELSNAAARTLDSTERYIALLLRSFPDRAFDEFTDGDLAVVLRLVPPKSRHIVKSIWNGWFEWGAYVSRRIPENPVRRLPRIKYRPNRNYDIFVEAEVDALCALPAPHGQLMTLLFWTGIRHSEARLMTGKRIDFNRGQVIVIDGAKGGTQRRVTMVDELATAMADLFMLEGIGRDDHLWGSRPGGGGVVSRRDPIGSTTFTRWWATCLKEAGVRYRRQHDARHTFATRLRELGMELEEIQRLLGHESISTTADTYVHADLGAIGDRLRELVGDRRK